MLRTIGVVSDTHGLLRTEAWDALAGSELILHAGDVGDLAILDRLREIAPVWAVRGNTDYGAVAEALPLTRVVDLRAPDGAPTGEVDEHGASPSLAYILHGHLPLDLDPGAAGIRLVVSGHTHEPLIQEIDSVLFLNPGSAGPRRAGLPVTVACVELGPAGAIVARIIDLTPR